MTSLPRFFVLESRGRYLSVTDNVSGSVPKGFLKFDEEQIWNPRVKFAAELAETGDGRLVHIRSCYNNKYLVVQQITHSMIVASGEKPEEDRSKDSCTLFEPTGTALRYFPNTMNVCHLAALHNPPADILNGATISQIEGTQINLFNVFDWERLVILPTRVSFRSVELDKDYLCSRSLDPRWPYEMFESGMDVGDPLVSKQLFPTHDGNYRIKDEHFDKLWRRSPNWIWADAEYNNSSNDTLFSVVKISDTVIALRNLGNNYFCGPLTTEGKTNCLNAHYPTISRQAMLMIEECVLYRKISDIRYRLSDSRIYHEKIQEVSHAFANNDSPDHESTITLKYSISDSRTTHWTNSVSINVGVTVKFEVSAVPFIASEGVEVSTEFGETYEWGVSQTTESTREVSYAVVVPPLTSMKVTLMCTKGACDVPFSYTQLDLLTTGEWVSTTKDDGVYTGINSYKYYLKSSKVPKDAQGRVLL